MDIIVLGILIKFGKSDSKKEIVINFRSLPSSILIRLQVMLSLDVVPAS